jgi:hypothetical protein
MLSSDDLALLEHEGLTLTEAAKLLPGRRTGKRISVQTLWRWCMKGLHNGVRLKSVLVGGQRLTTRTWLQEFIEVRTQAAEPEDRPIPRFRTPTQRQRDSQDRKSVV